MCSSSPPFSRHGFAQALGLDRLLIYRVAEAKRSFTLNNPSYVSLKQGMGLGKRTGKSRPPIQTYFFLGDKDHCSFPEMSRSD